MARLLAPDGCPWDREQTLESLRQYAIEEAFEVVEAIDRIGEEGGPENLKEELGDLLFQVVFQTAITERKGWFDLDDVIEGIRDKMIRRHTWVFGDDSAGSADSALNQWEANKAKEKEKKKEGALSGVPSALPALLRAQRIGEKAAASGYDWKDASAVREKVGEEISELDEALAAGEQSRIEAEFGDVLFAMSSLARKAGVDAEAALRRSLDTFSRRFRHAEVASEGRLRELTDEERDVLWEEAKSELAR